METTSEGAARSEKHKQPGGSSAGNEAIVVRGFVTESSEQSQRGCMSFKDVENAPTEGVKDVESAPT